MSAPLAIRKRIAVDVERDLAALDAALAHLVASKPSGRAEVLSPFGFSFRREPLVLHFVATGFAIGMSLLLTDLCLRSPKMTYVGGGLAIVFFLLGVLSMSAFAWSYFRREEVHVAGGFVVHRSLLGARVRGHVEVAGERIVAVLVIGADGALPKVVLAGPRHAILAEVFAARALDPETLAPWLAEMVAVVARRATIAASG